MSTRRFYLLVLLLVMGCQRASIGESQPAAVLSPPQQVADVIPEAELSKQLKINKDALLKGSNEQIRIDAATVMLFNKEPLARKILLETLKQAENRPAQIAVCKALSQVRLSPEPLANKSDFIEPLLSVLSTGDPEVAKLAADATLIFSYEQISSQLETIAVDTSKPIRARLNAIDALKLRPDKRAIIKLIDLLDDSEKQVADGAKQALVSLGIPVVDKDPQTLMEIVKELNQKDTDEFLRDWLIRQDEKMRQLEKESRFWRELYLTALGKLYEAIHDDGQKGQFLIEYLGSPELKVRLWALEKISQWRIGGTKSKLPAELGPVLVKLISDPDKEVRLRTAKLLSLMDELDSAQHLLGQLKVEKDDEVRMELFVALGGTCYYALLPNSGITISPEIRKEALELAAKYLFEQDTKKAQKSAEVMKKLLEQEGLKPDEVDRYLGLLAERYKSLQDNNGNGVLREELLSAMAGLCAHSFYKAESSKFFKPLFEESLHHEANLVREAAAEGLICIDKSEALKVLRHEFVNDSSAIIRMKLVDVAGEIGTEDDLPWLWDKLGTSAESEPAWQTMLKIFKRSQTAVLTSWISKLESPDPQPRLSDERMISFLEVAERKVDAENNKQPILKDIKQKLTALYIKTAEFERAAEYLKASGETAQTAWEKEEFMAELMNVYLRWPNLELAVQLVNKKLLVKDLGSDSVFVRSIDNCLSKPPNGTNPNAIIEALAKIKTTEPRPLWEEQVKRWSKGLGKLEVPEGQGKTAN